MRERNQADKTDRSQDSPSSAVPPTTCRPLLASSARELGELAASYAARLHCAAGSGHRCSDPHTRPKLALARATFWNQVWIDDYAVVADPEGDRSWEVTPEFLDEYRNRFEDDDLSSLPGVLDDFRLDPGAPAWIREWHGPFEIHLELEYFDFE